MINKVNKFLVPIIIIIFTFFIKIDNAKAVDKCTWEMYQSYITTTDTGDYGVNAINHKSDNNTKFKWYLRYDASWINNYRIVENDTNYIKKFSSTNFDSFLKDNTICPKYVVLSAKGDNEELKVAISEEFKEYYNTQYNGIINKVNFISMNGSYGYYSYFIDDISKKPIVFIRQEFTEYPSKHLNKAKQLFKPSDFGISECNMNCSLGIQEFYKITRVKWFKVVNSLYSEIVCDEKSCSKGSNPQLVMAFSKWFTEDIARLVLEEDYEMFLKCYKLAGTVRNKTETEFKIFNDKLLILQNLIGLNETNEEKSELISNPCSVICSYENEIAVEQCRISSTYKSCENAYEYCEHIQSSSSREECIKSKMGTANYTNFQNLYQNALKENEQKQKDLEEKIRDLLKNVDDPGLEGIEFKPYEVKCEDVVIFRIIYKIMTIMAPILVILFGSIDYAQAVFSSDEKKMQDSKKKFPKRVLLLVLFVAIPTIISIIMSMTSGETNLMKCVILGE